MRVELKIDANCEEAFAVIHTSKLTPALQAAIEILENDQPRPLLTAQAEDKIFVIDPDMIVVICTEGRSLIMYDMKKAKFVLNKPLYELQQLLGINFIRISKSALINSRFIHHVKASMNGTMEVVMKNGITETITRSYRQQFKKRLN